MKQLIFLVTIAIAIANPTLVNAGETINLNSSDLEQLQQLACTGDSPNSEFKSSLEELETELTQALAEQGIELDEQQLQAAYIQAMQIKSQLETNSAVQNFCADY